MCEGRIIYVNAGAPREGSGSKETPFRRISDAAEIARAESATAKESTP